AYEGCLSFPGHNGAVTRPAAVKVRAQDRNGNWFELEAEGLLARCIQHETDHLNGILFIEKAISLHKGPKTNE
uniref:peptide deformylase n=1 Tax=Dialister succinatiphilus TaxID=487173 RepID=UPI003F7FC1FA